MEQKRHKNISERAVSGPLKDKEDSNGAYQDIEYEKSAEYRKEGWMRRVPDILPVCMQDFLHRGKSELRAEIIRLRL